MFAFIWICTYIYIYIYICVCVCVYICIYTCMCVSLCVCTYMCVDVCMIKTFWIYIWYCFKRFLLNHWLFRLRVRKHIHIYEWCLKIQYIYIYIYIHGKLVDFCTEQSENFWGNKETPRSLKICIYIFAFLSNQRLHSERDFSLILQTIFASQKLPDQIIYQIFSRQDYQK